MDAHWYNDSAFGDQMNRCVKLGETDTFKYINFLILKFMCISKYIQIC